MSEAIHSPGDIAQKITQLCRSLWPGGGVYLEVGANDGVNQSNTMELENHGWTGILIEPSPVAFESLTRNRPNNRLFNCALVGSETDEHLLGTFSTGSLMASADVDLLSRDQAPPRFRGEIWLRSMLRMKARTSPVCRVSAKTLLSVVRESELTHVDIAVIDVEGYELEALKGAGDFRPNLFVIETRSRDAMHIDALLLSMGYVQVQCLSNFSSETHPAWSGDHQDFLWCHKSFLGRLLAHVESGP